MFQACWDGVVEQASFAERQEACDEFNKANRWRKRGLAVIPTKFGISFTTKFLNQAGALVHVYTDGTVLVTHGGVEMGQGLHTKVAQVSRSILSCVLVCSQRYAQILNVACMQTLKMFWLLVRSTVTVCNKCK